MQAFLERKWVRITGYMLFSVVALVFFFYFTFPAQAVGQRIAQEIQKRTNGSVSVMFTDVSLYRLSGLKAEKVKIRTNPEEGTPLELEVDALRVRLRLLPLLWLSLSVNGGVDLGKGSIDAQLTKEGDGYALTLDVDEVDLAKPALLAKLTDLPLLGMATGHVDAKIGFGAGADKRSKPIDASKAEPAKAPPFNPEQTEGTVSLTISKAGIGAGTISGFTIPEAIDLGELSVAMDMKRGRSRIVSFKQKGGQLQLDASGSTNLRPSLGGSTLDSCFKFKFADQTYLDKNPKMKTVLELAAVQLKKDPEGYLNLKLGGTFNSPRRQNGLCRPGAKP